MEAIPTLHYSNLSKHHKYISHEVTTRLGGVSKGSYAELNLGLHQGDKTELVVENRLRLCARLGVDINSMVFAQQVHGKRVARITQVQRGAGGLTLMDAIPEADAMITSTPNTCLVTLAADCISLLFFDPKQRAVGVAHAGWKGTALAIAGEVVKAFGREFGSSAGNLLVGIGPANGPCCYEVGCDVADAMQKLYSNTEGIIAPTSVNGKYLLNQWEANRRTLIESGVKPSNIEAMELCTQCNSEQFYSARLGHKGRFGSAIMLK